MHDQQPAARRMRFALLLLVVAAGVATTPARSQPGAEEILARSIAHHDPEGRFLSSPHRLSFEETRPEGPARHTEVVIDVVGERFEMVRQGEQEIAGQWSRERCALTIDGHDAAAEQDDAPSGCERVQRMRDYYTYLWALPMKLRDPGTRLGAVTETEFDGRPVYGMRVTYAAAVGTDVWYFYFDRTTHALVGYRFYHDETKNDGEYILLAGEVEAAGMRIPKQRTWYTHQDDRLLGTDTLVAITPLENP